MTDPRAWHDLFMLTGGAAATLAGLVFVSISFAIGAQPEREEGDVSAWVTPSLAHFGEVFAVSAAFLAPVSAHVQGALLAGVPALGVPWGLWRVRYFARQHRQERLDAATWIWQIVLPMFGHAAIATGGALLLLDQPYGPPPVAGAACLLIGCAVRNAWMTVVYLLDSRTTSS
jgi:hypothetical protein